MKRHRRSFWMCIVRGNMEDVDRGKTPFVSKPMAILHEKLLNR